MLVFYLDQRREEASISFQILQLLCSQRVDPSSHHTDLLARLQGVQKLSVLFCPRLQTGKGLLQAASVASSFVW